MNLFMPIIKVFLLVDFLLFSFKFMFFTNYDAKPINRNRPQKIVSIERNPISQYWFAILQ